jgi:hypothetical protein
MNRIRSSASADSARMQTVPSGRCQARARSKPAAVETAVGLIAESTMRTRRLVGYLDWANGDDEPFWRPPSSKAEVHAVRENHLPWPRFDAPEDNVIQGLRWLQQLKGVLTAGSVLFVLSDFLVEPDEEAWGQAFERRWDVVPVVIQDPLWEASFPEVGPVTVPIADPATGAVRPVRVSRREARARRERNEERRRRLISWFHAFDLEPVVLESSDVASVLAAFLSWADQRMWARRGTL